jgi:hypothetical protein
MHKFCSAGNSSNRLLSFALFLASMKTDPPQAKALTAPMGLNNANNAPPPNITPCSNKRLMFAK